MAPISYSHKAVPVFTYPVGELTNVKEMRENQAHNGFEYFLAILREFHGDIYHQHSWSRGCGALHLTAAKTQGLRTVVTVHVPNVCCIRGTMRLFGNLSCDGVIKEERCGACYLQGRGIPEIVARFFGNLPRPVAEKAYVRSGSLMTALAARIVAEGKLNDLVTLFREADRIIVVCQWLYDALLANGAPREKLVLNRQGLAMRLAEKLRLSQHDDVGHRNTPGPLRLLFIGRWDPVKGADVLVRAMRNVSRKTAVELTIYGVAGDDNAFAWERRVREMAADDSRITFAGRLTQDDLPTVLVQHDVIAVPSVWLETGPIVVLEGLAAGLFVLGSQMGGVAELINSPEKGRLVAAGDVSAWTQAIEDLSLSHVENRLSRRAWPVRTMEHVADEMVKVYETL
jgi:glycosyltransferase involved in cell wall biosynthesis